ncbi:response regulator transcription factor [Phytohabitans sp. ZYX-F-186]|uniref:Response regulator transcription factor n=1 Tax=Phytohabitans maris TaxID=3071409 RepID=A0ABU0ZJ45_9ACTN|nr:response regulator transcription factor [Phytohabitans sp. ZYX-F-186]MDQ7906429.1 response regulator transcription factor [Phytohabitans sp. ZYX-F-186]
MIRTLLILDGALVRGALAFVLSAQDDIEVVGEGNGGDDAAALIRSLRPDVVVTDVDAMAVPHRRLPCPALVLASQRQARRLAVAVRRQAQPCGFLGDHVAPQRVVDGVRRLARGEPVADARLAAAALARKNPLTERETEILEIAATGSPAKDIAARLHLSPGTVRNYLSRVVAKAGARTRIEAVRIAQESGWI